MKAPAFWFALMLALVAIRVSAQETRSMIFGRVLDPSVALRSE